MRFDLFSKGDSVLLLGEGNFSFAVSLHKQNLPIKIVATGFSSECEFEGQQQNIEYLKSNKVPVFLNVDATKLLDNVNFSDAKFSKIVFNFPHIGGKMKIHLNRLLLQKVFENCSKIITKNGLIIVSLCQGQGGTPADKPQRRWDDTWQVTELAAHGDLILIGVEPFLSENFVDYQCVGYRGRSTGFHTNGALVHIFAKREPPYPCLNDCVAAERLNLVPLRKNSSVLVPIIYSELYQKNPMENTASHISFFKHLLVNNFSDVSGSEWKYLNDDQIPVYVENGLGVPCQVNSIECALRSSPFDVLLDILKQLFDDKIKSNFVLFPGMYFHTLGTNFLENAPVQFQFVITGEYLLIKTERFLNSLIDLFRNKNVALSQRSLSNNFKEMKLFSFNSGATEFVYENCENKKCVSAAFLFNLRYKETDFEVAFINAQIICQFFFQIGWREIWAQSEVVLTDGKPTFRQILLYPSFYKFDITLKYEEFYSEEQFFKILWLAAGQLIEGIETVNEYISAEGWSSKCYRVTYKSLDKPLYRNRVIDIHSKIVGRALEFGLNVIIS